MLIKLDAYEFMCDEMKTYTQDEDDYTMNINGIDVKFCMECNSVPEIPDDDSLMKVVLSKMKRMNDDDGDSLIVMRKMV